MREKPASFADHYSQPRMFLLSLSPVEKDHTIQAYTFELGKCYETAIRERTLRVLANIDPTSAPASPKVWACQHPSRPNNWRPQGPARGPQGDLRRRNGAADHRTESRHA